MTSAAINPLIQPPSHPKLYNESFKAPLLTRYYIDEILSFDPNSPIRNLPSQDILNGIFIKAINLIPKIRPDLSNASDCALLMDAINHIGSNSTAYVAFVEQEGRVNIGSLRLASEIAKFALFIFDRSNSQRYFSEG